MGKALRDALRRHEIDTFVFLDSLHISRQDADRLISLELRLAAKVDWDNVA